MERRDFLKASIISSSALPLLGANAPIAKRPYNKDVSLSVIGFGGIVIMGMEQPDADRTVANAVARGINYFDVAPSYGDGEAEQKLGPALEPLARTFFWPASASGAMPRAPDSSWSNPSSACAPTISTCISSTRSAA